MPQDSKSIFYKEGYKYQLVEDACIQTSIRISEDIKTDFIYLTWEGFLTVKKGYAWDGASGPTVDTSSSMRGSLFHDALYQLMRLGLLNERWRGAADNLFWIVCSEDGMNWFRAAVWEMAVELFGASAAKAGTERKIIEAP